MMVNLKNSYPVYSEKKQKAGIIIRPTIWGNTNRFGKIICLIILFCPFAALRAQFDAKLSELGLKGGVKSIVEREYQVENYDYDKQKEVRRVTLEFNPNGCKTKEEYSSASGEVSYSGIFGYDESGTLTEEKVNNYGYNKNFVKQYQINDSKIIVNITYDAGTSELYAKYNLNSKGDITQRIDYDKRGTYRIFKYTYNRAGLLQSEAQQMPQKTINFQYTYNAQNKVEKKAEVTSSGRILHIQTYTYDSNGNIASEVSSYADDPEKLTINYKYVLDSAGNWIEKQEYMNNNLFSVIKREIAYY
ncbi:MAG: hypothetical protein LBR10_05485 [Prevotellaceae bacterium]|jgi:hypothetical protein|nr:hypothetical protein [Prevotellaceae bacterium]